MRRVVAVERKRSWFPDRIAAPRALPTHDHVCIAGFESVGGVGGRGRRGGASATRGNERTSISDSPECRETNASPPPARRGPSGSGAEAGAGCEGRSRGAAWGGEALGSPPGARKVGAEEGRTVGDDRRQAPRAPLSGRGARSLPDARVNERVLNRMGAGAVLARGREGLRRRPPQPRPSFAALPLNPTSRSKIRVSPSRGHSGLEADSARTGVLRRSGGLLWPKAARRETGERSLQSRL